MTELVVRRADLADAPTLSALWRIGAQRQRRAGAPSWPDDMVNEARAEAGIRASEAHLVLHLGVPVAAFLFQAEDATFWDDRPEDEAFYLHRIAVDPGASGASGGRATRVIVDWAASEAVRLGRYRLRLDCAPLPKLAEVYTRLGFTILDRCNKSGFEVFRFERRVGREDI